ncbi:MAG: DUF2336 domain-containing protein [Xanthobacteraceae bacterium]
MIVRQFLQWVRTAPAGERAEAAGALARAFLFSDLPITDRVAVEAAMVRLLDDVSPLVRAALAETLATSPDAPAAVIHALAQDRSDIAAIVLERSPLFIDAELVDFVATGKAEMQCAIARRPWLPAAVAAAIVEVGCAEACLELIENPDAELAALSFDRLVERFGELAAIREALIARDDLPVATRQTLVLKLSAMLTRFVVGREWLEADHARRVAREACEKATVALAAHAAEAHAGSLVRHLRLSGQLTAGLILRALLSGNIALFEQALAELSELPLARVRALIHDTSGLGFRSVFGKAELPPSTYTAFRHALEAWREGPDLDGVGRLRRRMVERVLTGCEKAEIGDLEPLMALLRRFAAEAAREEARDCCDLLEDDGFDFFADDEDEEDRVAA